MSGSGFNLPARNGAPNHRPAAVCACGQAGVCALKHGSPVGYCAYKVTHVDSRYRRRQLVLECSCRAVAEALAEAMYGLAIYLAAVRLKAVPQ
jgi:ABC-type branched-subunit amino acid transport system permease subunit